MAICIVFAGGSLPFSLAFPCNHYALLTLLSTSADRPGSVDDGVSKGLLLALPSLPVIKMKELWKGIKRDINVGEFGTWIILTFANREARDLVWINRPYRVQNKLVLLKEYSEDFDPMDKDVSHADIWVRIPMLRFYFHNDHALNMIIRDNNIGTYIRMDENTSIKNKRKFVRFCINVSVPNVAGFVKIEHTDKSILTFKLWSEDYSPGCGCCGKPDHLFDDCFLNNLPPHAFEFNLVGFAEDEEAAKQTKQKLLGSLLSKTVVPAQAQKVPNFVRKTPPIAPKKGLQQAQILPSANDKEKSSSTLLRKLDGMDIETHEGSSSTQDAKSKEAVEENVIQIQVQ